MKRIILVLNGKGGVGKSFFAVNLVQFLKDKATPHASIDTDNENSTLTRFHQDATFLDLEDPRALDAIFGALETAPLVVTDCRAASTDRFLTFFDEIRLPQVLTEVGAALTLAIPVNHEADSVDQVQRLAEQLAGTAQYLIIRNASHSESFALFEALEFRKRLTGELGAREISMPRLHDWLVEALNRQNVTVTAAIKHPAFGLLDRQRLQTWQRRLYTSLESVQAMILPAKEGVARA